MERYVAYIRGSKDDQSLYSLDAQQHAIEKWVRVKGGEVVESYVGDGISGRSTNRPAFQQMREDAEIKWFEGKHQAVIEPALFEKCQITLS